MTSDKQIASILHLKVDLPNALFLNSVSIVTFERDVHFYMGFRSVDQEGILTGVCTITECITAGPTVLLFESSNTPSIFKAICHVVKLPLLTHTINGHVSSLLPILRESRSPSWSDSNNCRDRMLGGVILLGRR